jgi:hypothetical protein
MTQKRNLITIHTRVRFLQLAVDLSHSGFQSRSRHDVCLCVSVLCCPVLVEAFATRRSVAQMNPTKRLNKITKPPVWDGQGLYKDCRVTDDDDDYDYDVDLPPIPRR